jgi:hypothetical protein
VDRIGKPSLSRQWKVFLIPHTHTDIGYTDPQEKVLEQHLDYLDQVIDLCEKTKNDPAGFRFCWTCEVSWQVMHYRRHRPAEQFAKLVDLIKAQRIDVSALYLNFTELLDLPMIVRSCQPAADLQREFGFAIRSAMCSDINGLPWGFAKVLPQLGVKYLNFASNATRALPRPPQFFWWEANDGQRLLVWDGPIYGMANILGFGRRSGKTWELLVGYLADLETNGYPHNSIGLRVQGHLGDNTAPTIEICEQARQLNSELGLDATICTNTEWFAFAERQLDLSATPVIRGAFPDWWSDGLGSTPQLAAAVRGAQRALRQGTTNLSPDQCDNAIEDLMFAAEHTFGAALSVAKPEDPNSVSQWACKNAFATRAVEALPDPVEWQIPASSLWKNVKPGESIETPFYALSLSPAGGLAKLLDRELNRDFTNGSRSPGFNSWLLERITSPEGRHVLWDDDMVSSETHHEFWVVNRKKSRIRRDTQFAYTAPELVRASTLRTDEHIWLKCELRLPACPSAVSYVRVSLREKRLDFMHLIDREFNTEASSLHLAFATSLHKPRVQLHSAGGAFAPGEQVPLSATDYYYVDDWLTMADTSHAILWCTLDAPLVQLGGPRMGRWSESFGEPSSTFFSWATNNYWYTNFQPSQHGQLRFRYSMTTLPGAIHPGAADAFAQTVTGDARLLQRFPAQIIPDGVVIREQRRLPDGETTWWLLEEVAGLETRIQFDPSCGVSGIDLFERPIGSKSISELRLRPYECAATRVVAQSR